VGDVLTKDEHHELLTDAMTASDPMTADNAARKIDCHDAALRAEVSRLEVERNTARALLAVVEARGVRADVANAWRIERDAALARAEKAEREHVECLYAGASALLRAEQAERERDEARVLYCCERASNGTSIYGEGDQCAWNTPRKVCDQTWPDATDALFPVEGKP